MNKYRRTTKFLSTWCFDQRYWRAFNWLTCLGGFLHLEPTVGCQISTLISVFFMEGRSLLISNEKYIKDGKVLDHLGIKWTVLPGPLAELSAWVGFYTSSPQQDVKYQLWYLIFFYGGEVSINIPWKIY